MKNTLFITLFVIVLATLTQASYYSDIVSNLHRLQDPSGAFKTNSRASPSLEATQDALFLSSLYGLGRKIDASNIPTYLISLRNDDGGYGAQAGAPSTLESTWRAVSSYAHLRLTTPDSQRVANFVRSQAEDGLFGDVLSTYYAVDTLNILQESTDLPQVKAFLQQNEQEDRFFDNQLENLYAIAIASAVNYRISNPEAFARRIVAFQTSNGGFIESEQNPVTSFLSTALSVQTVGLLENQSGRTLSNFIPYDKIVSFVQTVPFDLSLAADAHKTLVFSPYFKNNFKLVTNFESASPVKDNIILFGSQFKPTFTARSFGGVSHSGFTVTGTITLGDKSVQDLNINWDNDVQTYTTDAYVSASVLGPISVSFDVLYFIPTIGEITFSHVAEAAIGYSLLVTADGTHELTGRKINQGDSISVGTTFSLNAIVKDKNSRPVTSGNFDVVFAVVDSSNVPIFTTAISAVDNKEPFSFTYTLTENNLPPGYLTFVVELQNTDGKGFNAQKLQYLISTPIVITSLNVEREYQLGSTVEISFVPAVFPDNRDIVVISPSRRIFYLDVSSSSGKLLNTYRGVASESTVTFSYEIESSFDFIGTNVLNFRFVTAEGQSVLLGNYDDSLQELTDDAPSYTVTAELFVVEISDQPGQNDFFYGNDITFKYTINDRLTNQPVVQGRYGYSYLSVNHVDEKSGRSFTSTKEVATQSGTELVVNWEINPNAVEGKGTLVLSAIDASGNELVLLEENSQKPIAIEVNIGGEIKETQKYFDLTDFYSTKSSFVLEFGLSCHHKPLKNAKLRASILRLDGGKYQEVASVPVASSGESYSVSYTSKHKDFVSGEYKVQVFREIDQTRASEAQDQRQKLLLQKQREAELAGEPFNEEEFLASLEVESGLKPILETTFTHKQVSKGGLFIRTEWVILIPLVAAFLYFDSKKRSYIPQK